MQTEALTKVGASIMRDDPIVAEVRAIRDKLAAECGYDVGEIFRRIRQRQAESGLDYVSYPPRRVASLGDAAVRRTAIGGGDHGA